MNKRQGAKAATGGTNDDDFDKMLEEVMAADSELSADVRASTATSSSSISSSGGPEVFSPGLQVSKRAISIAVALDRRDIAQLRRYDGVDKASA
jgi:hypothetical protein